jgi:hypothetical protein
MPYLFLKPIARPTFAMDSNEDEKKPMHAALASIVRFTPCAATREQPTS